MCKTRYALPAPAKRCSEHVRGPCRDESLFAKTDLTKTNCRRLKRLQRRKPTWSVLKESKGKQYPQMYCAICAKGSGRPGPCPFVGVTDRPFKGRGQVQTRADAEKAAVR